MKNNLADPHSTPFSRKLFEIEYSKPQQNINRDFQYLQSNPATRIVWMDLE
jgi:hypothetical protein